MAAKSGNEELVKLLIARGADVNAQDALWQSPLMLAITHAPNPDSIINILIQEKCDVNLCGGGYSTALHLMARRGNDVTLLINAGADVTKCDAAGDTPLHCAASEGQVTALEGILAAGCDINYGNHRKRSAIHQAALYGYDACVETLLEWSGCPFQQDSSGCLPVHHAARGGHYRTTWLLLTINSPLMVKSKMAEQSYNLPNPLVGALQNCHFLTAALLVTCGCDCKPLVNWLAEEFVNDKMDKKVVDLLKSLLYSPASLSNSCRQTIRYELNTRFSTALDKLPLPNTLKNYLALDDLEDPNQWT